MGAGSAPPSRRDRELARLAAARDALELLTTQELERIAAHVHAAWMRQKAAAGVSSRKSESGEELMVDYALLSEQAKELDRATVRAVYDAIAQASAPEHGGP